MAGYDYLYLLNPATKEFKMLRYPKQIGLFSHVVFGFGYSPRSFSQEYTKLRMELVELGGFLSLYGSKDDKNFDIWVMKDYGDEQSWTKVFSVAGPILSEIPRLFRPLYILKKDEEVLCESDSGFDIFDGVKKKIHTLCLGCPPYDFGTEIYFESLVLLGPDGGMACGNKQERSEKEGEKWAVAVTGD